MAKPENQSPATKFIGAICLEAFAAPFFEEGTKALFERAYARTAIAYSICAVPAVAGLLTVAILQADNVLYRLLKQGGQKWLKRSRQASETDRSRCRCSQLLNRTIFDAEQTSPILDFDNAAWPTLIFTGTWKVDGLACGVRHLTGRNRATDCHFQDYLGSCPILVICRSEILCTLGGSISYGDRPTRDRPPACINVI